MVEKRKDYPLYRAIKWCVKTVYPKIEVVGLEKLPQEPVVIVGNHSQMNGPIAVELYAPGKHYTWCAGEMLHLKEVPAYAYADFWSGKPKWTRPFYKALSYIIAPLSVCVFNNADTIAVYHDTRIISTFKQTVQRLREGSNVVIFPEHAEPHDHILNRFQTRFVDVAKLYHKRTGGSLCFVPMYLAPRLRRMYLGDPIRFAPERPIGEERERIASELMAAITAIAVSLPEHTVVPYSNIPKKRYSTNVPPEKA